jgi:hypothetical protein
MHTPSDGRELRDAVLEQEIELLADLMDAVALAGHPLGQSEIDEVLGVDTGALRALS